MALTLKYHDLSLEEDPPTVLTLTYLDGLVLKDVSLMVLTLTYLDPPGSC